MPLRLHNYSLHLATASNRTIILDDVDCEFHSGTTTYILGKNGSGKSSLLLSLAWAPYYSVTGDITLHSEDILNLDASERSERGIFIALQSIPSIPGVTYGEFLRTIYAHKIQRDNPEFKISPFVFGRMLQKHLDELHLSKDILKREVNVGFSGGEKRRLELLQMRLLDPSVILLDEIESWLDIWVFELLISELTKLRSEWKTLIIVTHNFELMRRIGWDQIVILENGKIIKTEQFSEVSREELGQYFDYHPDHA